MLVPVKTEIESLEIANRFLIGQSVEQISKDMGLSEDIIKYTLTQEKLQDYISKSASNKEIQLHLRRIDRATDMMDILLTRIEEFITDESIPISKWKDSHVSLMKDVLLNKLPSTINKAIGTAININLGWPTTQTSVNDWPLRTVLSKLDPSEVILFRDVIEEIASHIAAGRNEIISDIKELLRNKIVESIN